MEMVERAVAREHYGGRWARAEALVAAERCRQWWWGARRVGSEMHGRWRGCGRCLRRAKMRCERHPSRDGTGKRREDSVDGEGSLRGWRSLMRRFSVFRRGRPRRWIHNIGCCWSAHGRRRRVRDRIRPCCERRKKRAECEEQWACTWELQQVTTRIGWRLSWKTDRTLDRRGLWEARRQDECRTFWE